MSGLNADGILYTEYKAVESENEIMNVKYPTVLKSLHVRADHLYRAVFEHVKENFAIAGFSSLIDVINLHIVEWIEMSELNFLIIFQAFLNFYGVYYQNVMEKLDKMDSAERDHFIAPIKEYRAYANDS